MSWMAVTLAAVTVLLPAVTRAQDHAHHHEMVPSSPNDPPIKITINPEARVSVTLGGPLPPPVACGNPTTLSVKIVNQGFVTSQLEAEFVGEAPAGVRVDFHPAPLKGIPEELRELHITLTTPGPTDLSLAFRAHNEIPDLGGRDRIHFLMRCL
jgi:hypothetical protein